MRNASLFKTLPLDQLPEVEDTDPSRPLMDHQKRCIAAAIERGTLYLRGGTGIGKTRIALEVIRREKEAGRLRRALVFTPSEMLSSQWGDQARLFTPSLTVVEVHGLRAERQACLMQKADVYLLHYPGVLSIFYRHPRIKGGTRANLITSLFDENWTHFDAIIFDECHCLGNPRTYAWLVAFHLIRYARLKIAMTGTPFGKNPILLWAQLYLLDYGRTLGKRLKEYRERFFVPIRNRFSPIPLWEFRKRKTGELRTLLDPTVIDYEPDECLDLPERTFIRVPIQFTDSVRNFYREVCARIQTEARLGEGEIQANFTLRRQITAGFVRVRKGDSFRDQDMKNPPKLMGLMDLLEEIPPDKKTIVFHEYVHSGELIERELTRRKISHLSLRGETHYKPEQVRRFTEEDIRILVANAATGGVGLNLQAANYIIYYESPVSVIVRAQSEGRIYRMGQNLKTFFYDLYIADSVDEQILDSVKEGKDLMKELFQHPERMQ
jgi:non-specific serine/threonine protein kinase